MCLWSFKSSFDPKQEQKQHFLQKEYIEKRNTAAHYFYLNLELGQDTLPTHVEQLIQPFKYSLFSILEGSCVKKKLFHHLDYKDKCVYLFYEIDAKDPIYSVWVAKYILVQLVPPKHIAYTNLFIKVNFSTLILYRETQILAD